MPLRVLYRVGALKDSESRSLLVAKGYYRGVSLVVNVTNRGYRGFDEGRYYFKASVNKGLDTF